MYFLVINVLLAIFFLFLIIFGIKIKIWSYVPINMLGFFLSGLSITLDFTNNLTQLRILGLFLGVALVFIIDFIITYRDIHEEEQEEPEIQYLTNTNGFEHHKIISDERIIKRELDADNAISFSDRLQALQAWKLGNRAYEKTDYSEALGNYDLSCNWVRTATAYINQSGVLIQLKRFDDSIELTQKAIEINPDSFEAYMNLGIAFQHINKFDEAINAFSRATDINPNSFEAWFCLGNVFQQNKEYERGVNCYSKSLKLNPDYAETWHNKGRALVNLERYDEAMKSFEQAIQRNKSHFKAYYRLGNVLSALDFNEEAIENYDKALRLRHNFVEAWNNRGIALNKVGKLHEAIKSYTRALKSNPDYYDAWMNLALAQDSLGKYKQALFSYKKFLEFVPAEKEKYITITSRRIGEIQEKLKPDVKQKRPKSSKKNKQEADALIE